MSLLQEYLCDLPNKLFSKNFIFFAFSAESVAQSHINKDVIFTERLIMKQEVRDFLPTFPDDETFAVTLTMKQHTKGESLDEMKASQNLRHFLNLLNRACFGTAARRKNMSVEVIPVLERSYSGRLHYHLTLRNPNPQQAFFFQQRIKDCWSKTDFADAQIDIQPTSDVSGWNRYITKDRRANIDWENYHAAR